MTAEIRRTTLRTTDKSNTRTGRALRIAMLATSAILCLLVAGCIRVNVKGDPAAAAEQLSQRVLDALAQAIPVRVATYNVSLYDESAGGLIRRLEADDDSARNIAKVLQRVRPDLVLLNEFDYDADGRAADLFQQRYLDIAQGDGLTPLRYPYRYFAPVNTGVPSGLDLNQNGKVGTQGRERGDDAWGYGLQPGQYGLLVLSRYPIDHAAVRSFQMLKWSAMPGARRPMRATAGGTKADMPFHPDAIWRSLRLSSKTHLDVPVDTPQGRLHFLVSHPTPPVYDGPEDRNGARNADELRLWQSYLDNTSADTAWLCDDRGRCGGLAEGQRFVIAGDLNNDPVDGDGRREAIRALIEHPRTLPMPAPRSQGAEAASARDGGANTQHRAPHAEDTGNFGPRVGNLRIDYVLPSRGFRAIDSGVFWPAPEHPLHAATLASDHHLVWVDLLAETANAR
jgi:endonuclease/exonuclease/phosphatase family metal-dependent hydrolase